MLLPTPIAWIKKILAILKSDLSPSQIALAFALGVFAGLPPMGLHVLIPSTLALLFRCSFRSFLISMGLFKLISLATAPVSFALGKWLLDTQRGMDAFWRWLFHLPVIAPMGYPRYLLFGALVLAMFVAIPVFFFVKFLVRRYRDSFASWVSGWPVSRWLKGKRGVGLARRLLAGGEASYTGMPRRKGVFRVLRREMLIGLPILYALAYLVAALVVPFFAATLATSTASWAVGSEIAASDSSFNLFTGRLTLSDVTVQDPDTPDENLLVIPEMTIDAGILPLVSRRVVFNSLEIANVELHVKREEDGTLNIDNPSSGWNADGYLQWAAQHAQEVDWLGLLRHLLDYLGQWEPPAPRDDGYAAYSGGRAFPKYRPSFVIERMEIGRILITLEEEAVSNEGPLPPITMLEAEISNLAFPPALRTEPVRLSLRGQWGDDPGSGFQISATFTKSDTGTVSTYEFALKRIDLRGLASFYATTLPVQVNAGLASVSGSLRLEGELASGSTSFLLEDLELGTHADHPLFGLPAGTSARVLEGINRYASEVPIVFGAAIEGTSDAPRLAWEAPLLEIAREGLMMAGERELNRTIEELGSRIQGLGGIEGVPIDASFQSVQQQAESAARSVIENVGNGLLEGIPVIGDLAGDGPGDESGGADAGGLTDLIPGLLENLLDPSSRDEGGEGE